MKMMLLSGISSLGIVLQLITFDKLVDTYYVASFQINPQISTKFKHINSELHHDNGLCRSTSTSFRDNNNNLFMISPFSGSSTSSEDTSFPRDVKEAVSKCRESVQKALENRLSRMDIEMPVGAKFGVEKQSSKSKNSKKLMNADVEGEGKRLTYDNLQTSDRELARIFVEMFQPVGGDAISTIFMDRGSADIAAKKWKNDLGAECHIQCINKNSVGINGGKKKKKKAVGFAAKMAAELDESVGKPFELPEKCEVAIFVAPGPKDLITVENICNKVGMETLVILLNARLGNIPKYNTQDAKELFTEEFEPVFHLAAASQEAAPGCLLHRAYPNDWLLARKPKVGQPKVISKQSDRFSTEECQQAFESMEVTDVEEAVENVLENVANWFK